MRKSPVYKRLPVQWLHISRSVHYKESEAPSVLSLQGKNNDREYAKNKRPIEEVLQRCIAVTSNRYKVRSVCAIGEHAYSQKEHIPAARR